MAKKKGKTKKPTKAAAKKPAAKKGKKAAPKKQKALKVQNPDNPTRLITPPFRVAFPHVFVPNPRQTEKEQFDIAMLFPKSTNMDHINAAIDHVVKEECKGSKKGLKMPIRDGDKDPAFEEYQESHADMHVMSARTTFKPGVVDKSLEDIIDPGDFYSGCWARASITCFHYDTAGNKGISFSLNNIQKLKDDEPFTAAGMKAQQEFSDEGIPDDMEDEDFDEESDDDSEEYEEEESDDSDDDNSEEYEEEESDDDSPEYDVDDDGFAIDEDGEFLLDDNDDYMNADGEAVDGETCEPLETEEEEQDEDLDEEDPDEDEDW